MAYLLDANVFIQAKNLHYGLDFCPAFWDWLLESNEAKRLLSIEKVGDEIDAGADELATWAASRGPGFFLQPDSAMIPALGSVSTWATRQNYARRREHFPSSRRLLPGRPRARSQPYSGHPRNRGQLDEED
jgi:hypothetical protein